MTATPTPSAKALALEALRDAIEEAKRPAPRPPVVAALLEIAQARLAAVEELKRARRAKKDKEPSA